MAEAGKEKDPWDKLAALTPLILGLAVTGLGSYFTNVYNYRQLQLNQIEALDKLRPLLTSTRPEDREFGYASFAALGYEQIAIRIIGLNKDQSGRPLLVSLQASGSPAVQSSAASALKTLDAEQKLVNLGEFGATVPDAAMTRDHPEIAQEAAGSPAHRAWAAEEARTLGMTSKLGEAVLYDTAVQWGKASAQRFADDSSKLTPPPLDTHEKQAAWLNAYLDERDRAAQQHLPQLYPALQRRTDRLRQLVASGDWELRTIDAAQADPAAPGATSGITPGANSGAPH